MKEENKVTKKSILPLIIFIVGLLFIAISLFLIFKPKESEKEPIEPQEEITGERELVDKKSKKKIDEFFDNVNSSTRYVKFHFVAGDFLSNSNKIYVAIHSLMGKNKYTKITKNNIPSKYKNDDYYKQFIDNGCLIEVTFDEIEKEHNKYFNTKADFSTLELDSVNELLCLENEKNFDEELKIMLLNTCVCNEEKSDITVYISKDKYTFDEENYYLYLYAGMKTITDGIDEYYKVSYKEKVEVDSFEGNETKFNHVKWIFDKNFNLIQIEII